MRAVLKAEPSTAHTREPRQARKGATVSGSLRVLEDHLAGAGCSRGTRRKIPKRSAQAISIPTSFVLLALLLLVPAPKGDHHLHHPRIEVRRRPHKLLAILFPAAS